MYQREIDIIKADLGIEDVDINWVWVHKKWLHRTKRRRQRKVEWFTTWGDYTHRQPRPRIRIATKRSYEGVVKCIAHELRHAWQRKYGVLLVEHIGGHSWKHTWSGTTFCAGRRVYIRKTYEERPHEIDASAYQEDAWKRLFGGTSRERQTPRTVVADLFVSALY